VSKTLNFVRRHGVGQLADCVLCRTLLHLLRLYFRFDPWHADAARACRPYKAQVAALAEAVHPAVAVEIGCGLGAIISRTKAARTIGLDRSPQAIAAARFLNGRRTRFAAATLHQPADVAAAVGEGPIDVLILVNWIDALPIDAIADALDALRKRIEVRHLLIDETPPGAGQHSHTVQALAPLGEVIESRRDAERALHLVRLAHGPLSRTGPST
jgi:hypothetical protein